jgi:hypothetical protein
VLDWVWDLAKSQAEAELEKTLALHVSGYAGVRSGAGFYCGGAGSGTCDEPGGVQVAGFLFTREIDVSGLPKSALDDDFVADCRARRWLRERARLGAVRGERDADPEGPLTWCPAMSVAFEVDRAAAAKEGTIRVRPIRRSLAVWRARARVVDPTGYVPWTWWQNGRDAEWWAPTAGDKDYLDDVEVTLALRAVYNTALGEARTAEDAKLFERRYDFPRVRLGSPDAAEGEAVAWSEPIPLVPRSVLRDTSYDGGAVALGSGTFVVTVTVVESDSMGDFLMSDASTLIEKARAAPKTYVTDVSEGDEER